MLTVVACGLVQRELHHGHTHKAQNAHTQTLLRAVPRFERIWSRQVLLLCIRRLRAGCFVAGRLLVHVVMRHTVAFLPRGGYSNAALAC